MSVSIVAALFRRFAKSVRSQWTAQSSTRKNLRRLPIIASHAVSDQSHLTRCQVHRSLRCNPGEQSCELVYSTLEWNWPTHRHTFSRYSASTGSTYYLLRHISPSSTFLFIKNITLFRSYSLSIVHFLIFIFVCLCCLIRELRLKPEPSRPRPRQRPKFSRRRLLVETYTLVIHHILISKQL